MAETIDSLYNSAVNYFVGRGCTVSGLTGANWKDKTILRILQKLAEKDMEVYNLLKSGVDLNSIRSKISGKFKYQLGSLNTSEWISYNEAVLRKALGLSPQPAAPKIEFNPGRVGDSFFWEVSGKVSPGINRLYISLTKGAKKLEFPTYVNPDGTFQIFINKDQLQPGTYKLEVVGASSKATISHNQTINIPKLIKYIDSTGKERSVAPKPEQTTFEVRDNGDEIIISGKSAQEPKLFADYRDLTHRGSFVRKLLTIHYRPEMYEYDVVLKKLDLARKIGGTSWFNNVTIGISDGFGHDIAKQEVDLRQCYKVGPKPTATQAYAPSDTVEEEDGNLNITLSVAGADDLEQSLRSSYPLTIYGTAPQKPKVTIFLSVLTLSGIKVVKKEIPVTYYNSGEYKGKYRADLNPLRIAQNEGGELHGGKISVMVSTSEGVAKQDIVWGGGTVSNARNTVIGHVTKKGPVVKKAKKKVNVTVSSKVKPKPKPKPGKKVNAPTAPASAPLYSKDEAIDYLKLFRKILVGYIEEKKQIEQDLRNITWIAIRQMMKPAELAQSYRQRLDLLAKKMQKAERNVNYFKRYLIANYRMTQDQVNNIN